MKKIGIFENLKSWCGKSRFSKSATGFFGSHVEFGKFFIWYQPHTILMGINVFVNDVEFHKVGPKSCFPYVVLVIFTFSDDFYFHHSVRRSRTFVRVSPTIIFTRWLDRVWSNSKLKHDLKSPYIEFSDMLLNWKLITENYYYVVQWELIFYIF